MNAPLKSVLLALVAAGCGGNIAVDSGDAGGDAPSFDSNAPKCNKPPWLVFDYMDGTSTAYSIHAMHPDGTAFHALDLGPKRATLPSVSRDSTKLVYVQYDDSGPNETEGYVLFDVATKISTPVGWPATVTL